MKSNNTWNPILKLAVWALIFDVAWALLAATMTAAVFSEVSLNADVGGAIFTAATLGLWVMTFFVALVQGALFLGVACFLVVLIAAFIKSGEALR